MLVGKDVGLCLCLCDGVCVGVCDGVCVMVRMCDGCVDDWLE